MGLQFCNEMILANQTIFCRTEENDDSLEDLTETHGYFLKPFKIGNIFLLTILLDWKLIRGCQMSFEPCFELTIFSRIITTLT